PGQAVLCRFGSELRGDGLARDLAGPHVVGPVQLRGLGLASAAWLPTAGEAVADASAQHQADLCQFGGQGAVALFETLEGGMEVGG
ncbi:MAG: hypothetical protein MUF84_19565, partial [Anaerolineae bacterium]|nr:hypothetical protein [Anaerolineae bacterium]